jgi:hypothetical protein
MFSCYMHSFVTVNYFLFFVCFAFEVVVAVFGENKWSQLLLRSQPLQPRYRYKITYVNYQYFEIKIVLDRENNVLSGSNSEPLPALIL